MKVDGGILTQGMVIALYNYMSQILVELVKMANLIITMTKAAACANRVSAVLDMQSDQKSGTKTADGITGEVEFRGVSARYSDSGNPALVNVSFLAKPGQTVGIIGGTGSGKTTLVSLIPRLYDASEGQVLIGGQNVDEYDMDSLRHQIGIVPDRKSTRLNSSHTS